MKNSCFRKQKRKLKKNIYGSKTMQQLSTTDLMKIIIAHTGWDYFFHSFSNREISIVLILKIVLELTLSRNKRGVGF